MAFITGLIIGAIVWEVFGSYIKKLLNGVSDRIQIDTSRRR